MARPFADILHAYEEASAELNLMQGYEDQYPDHYQQLLAEYDKAKAEYDEAMRNPPPEYDFGDDEEGGVCEPEGDEPLMSTPEDEPNSSNMCGPEDSSSSSDHSAHENDDLQMSVLEVPLTCEPEPQASLVCGAGDTVFLDVPQQMKLFAKCQHGARRVGAGTILKVVAASAEGDGIELVNEGDATDVAWTSSDGSVEVIDAKTARFTAYPDFSDNIWLLTMEPRKYTITGEGGGQSKSITVHAYPGDEKSQSFKLDPDIRQAIQTGWEIVKASVQATSGAKLDDPTWEISLSFTGQWVEGTKAAEADWTFKVTGKVAITWGMTAYIGSKQISSKIASLPGVGKYAQEVFDQVAEANIYASIQGSIAAAASYDSTNASNKTIATNENEFTPKVGAKIAVAGGKVLEIILEVVSGVKGNIALKWDRNGPYAEPSLEFKGISGEGNVLIAKGWITWKRAWVLMDKKPFIPNEGEPNPKYYLDLGDG